MSAPTFWRVQNQLMECKTSKEKALREESLHFGIDRGVSIPLHGPNEDFAVFVVLQRQGENCFENIEDVLPELISIAHYFFNQLK